MKSTNFRPASTVKLTVSPESPREVGTTSTTATRSPPGRPARRAGFPARVAINFKTGTVVEVESTQLAMHGLDVKIAKRIQRIEAQINLRKALDPASPSYADGLAQRKILELVVADIKTLLVDKKLGAIVPQAVKGCSELLQEKFLPRDHAYVMLGNSTAALMGWMEMHHPDATMAHLALGGIASPDYASITKADHERLAPIVHAHIDQALLDTLRSTDKTLVLVDYVSTGTSLLETASLIKRWLATKSITRDVKIFGYAKQVPKNFGQHLSTQGHEGSLAVASGQTEKAFAHMNEDKLIKNVLQLRGAQSGTLGVVKGKADLTVESHPQDWERVKRLLAAYTPPPASDILQLTPGWNCIAFDKNLVQDR